MTATADRSFEPREGPATGSITTARRVEQAFRSLPLGAGDALPEGPGVYVFRDATGDALYVGKAAILRSRVAQHFTGVSRAVRLDDGLLARVVRVDHEETDCELGALLRETALIETLRPPYNTQRATRGSRVFLQLTGGPFPRARAVAGMGENESGPGHSPLNGASETVTFGPYRTTRDVRDTIRTVSRVFLLRTCTRVLPAKRAAMREPCIRLGQGLCPAPCAAEIAASRYATLVGFAHAFLTHGRDAALDAVEARLAELGEGRRSEAAPGLVDMTARSLPSDDAGPERTLLRRVRSRLVRISRERFPIGKGPGSGRLLLVYPTRYDAASVYFVEGGNLIARRTVDVEEASLESLLANWPDLDPAASLTPSQTNVLRRWIHQRYGEPDVIEVPAVLGPGSVPA